MLVKIEGSWINPEAVQMVWAGSSRGFIRLLDGARLEGSAARNPGEVVLKWVALLNAAETGIGDQVEAIVASSEKAVALATEVKKSTKKSCLSSNGSTKLTARR